MNKNNSSDTEVTFLDLPLSITVGYIFCLNFGKAICFARVSTDALDLIAHYKMLLLEGTASTLFLNVYVGLKTLNVQDLPDPEFYGN